MIFPYSITLSVGHKVFEYLLKRFSSHNISSKICSSHRWFYDIMLKDLINMFCIKASWFLHNLVYIYIYVYRYACVDRQNIFMKTDKRYGHNKQEVYVLRVRRYEILVENSNCNIFLNLYETTACRNVRKPLCTMPMTYIDKMKKGILSQQYEFLKKKSSKNERIH